MLASNPGRDVERNATTGRVVHRVDHFLEESGDRAIEPRAEQRVDDDRSGRKLCNEALRVARGDRNDLATHAEPRVVIRRCVARELVAMRREKDPDGAPKGREPARDHEPVTAVVPGTADDHDVPRRLRQALEDDLRGAATRVLHENQARNAASIDGVTVERANLIAGQNGRHVGFITR